MFTLIAIHVSGAFSLMLSQCTEAIISPVSGMAQHSGVASAHFGHLVQSFQSSNIGTLGKASKASTNQELSSDMLMI